MSSIDAQFLREKVKIQKIKGVQRQKVSALLPDFVAAPSKV